jgi:heat shock protein HtpX
MKFSRYREFKADAGSAGYVGKEKMIAGLKALQAMQPKLHPVEVDSYSTMKIAAAQPSGFKMLFASHPPLEARIKALEALIIR